MTDDPSVIVQLCAFAVGRQEYAIDVMRIRSIVRPLPVTPIPHAPPFVEGVVELRSSVIPVVDLRARLGVPAGEPGPKARMIIVYVSGREVALRVDRVLEVMRVPRSTLRAAPSLHPHQGPRFHLGVCEAVGRGEPVLRLLLNVRALVESLAPVPPALGSGA